MTYKCKICGGQTTVDSQGGIIVCEYCGTKQALPLFTDNSERLLYDRGNNYLNHSEYDKAENVFNQLLTIKPGAAELYWDLVLCKYGVTYVKDPKTEKYIPTCNRTHYTPVFSDENYKKAVELSSGEKNALFKEDAKTIDNIQKGIIAVSKKEKPFDIFISYKETDANGNRTKDSVEAQKLYEKLTEAGYKVFFSRITLEDKIGTEYEPYIYAALYSSKVMLTICSSKENIEAVWVKNEWSRFLGFRQNDNSKTLLPLYFGMDKAELPEEFALLSAYDIHTDGFEDELLRGIKKLIPLPIMKAKRRKQILKATGIVAASLVVVAGIVAAIIIPQKLEEKRLAEEEAIRASEVAALEKANEEAYQAAMTLFDNTDYTAAEAAFIALGDYKDSAHMAARCPIQPDYDAAMQLFYDGKYAQATWAFEALGDYEDAAVLKGKAELSWRKSLSTVAISNLVNNKMYGSYYINSNGTIDTLPQKIGTAHKDTGINVVSITSGKQLVVLHNDGVLENVFQNGDTNKTQWQNVVQNVQFFNKIHVALKADGTVFFGDMTSDNDWLSETVNWKNIIMLSAYYYEPFDYMGESSYAVLVGIDAEGNIKICSDSQYLSSIMDHLDVFKDIKTIDVGSVGVVALRNDGKLVGYLNGQISVEDAKNVVDAKINGNTIYKLCSDGSLYQKSMYEENTSDPIMSDVVAITRGYLITRSGTVYCANDLMKFESTGVKSCIYDEWLARMR